MRKSLSIVIPAFNEESYLPRTLDTIAAQTVMPDEVIVVDNNSQDGTAAAARKYPFVTVISQPQQGRIFAQSAGFDAASCEIIARLDADTWLPADWVETLHTLADAHPTIAGFTGQGTFYDAHLSKLFGKSQVFVYQYLQYPAMRGMTLWGANMAVRRSAYLKIKDELHMRNDIDEDIDMSLIMQKHHLKIGYFPNLTIQASLGRGQTNPLQVARYLQTWPRDYTVNKRPVAWAYIVAMTYLLIVVSSITWLFLLPLDFGRRPFSARNRN